MAEIIITREGQGVERYLVNKDRMTIGRAATNDIVLEDLSVSRSHAEISVEGDRFFLTDMGSANGLRVNGVSITDTELFHDDVILIGESTLLFVTTQSETEPVPEIREPLGERAAMPGEEPDLAFLTVRCPRQRPQMHAVTQSSVQIGRARDNEVRVVDWFVEPYQARILPESGGFRLVNLSPRTPIFCNQEVIENVLLQDGDVIQMGMSQIAFAIQDEAAREIEIITGAQLEEAPAGGATEYMAYVSADESFETPKPFGEAAAAELDNAIDQVIGDSSASRAAVDELQWDSVAQPVRPGPAHEPWDRWAEELATDLPPETASETPPDSIETESVADLDAETQEEEAQAEESLPPVQSSLEEQVFADLEGIVESDGENRQEVATQSGTLSPEPGEWGVSTQEEELEFLETAFTPVEIPPSAEMENEPDEMDASEAEPEPASEESLVHPAFASGALAWVEDETLLEESENPPRETLTPESATEEEESAPVTDAEPPAPAEECPAEDRQSDVDPAKVAFWEKALRNPSPAVVKQALEQLKRLTGRDYDL